MSLFAHTPGHERQNLHLAIGKLDPVGKLRQPLRNRAGEYPAAPGKRALPSVIGLGPTDACRQSVSCGSVKFRLPVRVGRELTRPGPELRFVSGTSFYGAQAFMRRRHSLAHTNKVALVLLAMLPSAALAQPRSASHCARAKASTT